jgi:glycosyltransferase involved in cell wall biosynthesis
MVADMEKLVVCIMGQNVERTIGMCLESIKDADAIVYCDGGSTDDTLVIVEDNLHNFEDNIIKNPYDQNDKQMNGKQRNFYLNYLKENYTNDWCLCLDADEVVDDINKVKEFIQTAYDGIYSVKMRHFIGDLGNEDATQEKHYVPNRLFKISEAGNYPEVEHPVLQPKIQFVPVGQELQRQIMELTDCTTIWHLAYIPNLWEIKKRYDNHLNKSNMHTPQFLKGWYYQHLFGWYPKKQIDVMDIPQTILTEFGIDKDEFYFTPRMPIEAKHFIMCKEWNDYFKPKYILDLGCGVGHYGRGFKIFNPDVSYLGLEKSKWAVENTPYKDLCLQVEDITKLSSINGNYDLVLCLDVLEHLEYKGLDSILKLIKDKRSVLFSIPYIGDPHLDADKTHIIKETKEWWVNKLSEYFTIKDVPSNWLFANQLLIGERKNG